MAVSCGLGSGRRNRWLMMIVLCLAFAGWCFYDGWVKQEAEYVGFNRTATVVLAVLAAGLFVALLVLKSRRLVADEQGIRLGGKTIAWDAFTEADDKDLSKGILVLTYKSTSEGQAQRLVLDEYNLSRFDDLLDEIAAHRPDLVPPAEPEGEPSS